MKAAVDEIQAMRQAIALSADGLGTISSNSMWRWVAWALGRAEQAVRPRLTLDDRLRERLAFWRGNVVAVHRELVDAAARTAAPRLNGSSFTTLVVEQAPEIVRRRAVGDGFSSTGTVEGAARLRVSACQRTSDRWHRPGPR